MAQHLLSYLSSARVLTIHFLSTPTHHHTPAQTLYESSVAFGMRKALLAEQGKLEMAARIEALETSERDLAKQSAEWKLKCELSEKRESERRDAEAKKHKEEVAYLESYARQLKGQLEALTNPAGKKGAIASAS